MRHLDDGALSALIDAERERGAWADGRVAGWAGKQEVEEHLAGCAACRARLEEARRLRDRAAGILSSATPDDVVAPPFEDLMAARAGAHRGRATRRLRLPLALAAAAALALTIGWYVRELSLRGARPAVTTSAAAPRQATRDAPTGPTELPGAAAPGAARAGAGRQLAAAEREGDAAPAPAQPGRPEATADEVKGAVGAAGAAAKVAEQQDRLAGAAPVAREIAPAAQANVQPADAPRIAQAVVVADVGWTDVTPERAARRLGGPLAVVEGLEIAAVAIAEDADGIAVRVQHRVGDRVLELVQRGPLATSRERAVAESLARTPVERTVVPAARTSTERVEWRGYAVSISGPFPADSLRLFLGRLRAR